MSDEPPRRLTRPEVNLLKHLARVAPIGFPVTLPHKLMKAVLPAWRLGVIEIWYRQDRFAVGGRRTQFVSITVYGHKRIHALLASFPSRASGPQGRSASDDQPSEPRQDKD